MLKQIFPRKLYYLKPFTFTNIADKPKVLKIDIDEQGNRKLKLEEFKPNTTEPVGQNMIFKKVKMFGQGEIETNSQDNQKEDIEENRLNRELFYSDHCRIYIKAGDGGNGLHSVIKGHLFDQSNIINNATRNSTGRQWG
jgi:hypothetical protein